MDRRSSVLEEPGSQSSAGNSALQDAEKFSIERYRLFILQKIAEQLPAYQNVTDKKNLTRETVVRYLVEGQENGNITSPSVSKSLNQYLYKNDKEHREEISKFFKKESQKPNSEILMPSIKAFILEAGESKSAHENVQKYYNEYVKFIESQERNLETFFEEYKKQLSNPKYAKVLDLWVKSVKDESLKGKLENQINQYPSLQASYKRFKDEFQLMYDWNQCHKNQVILDEYAEYIIEKGPLSGSCRELLAHIFDVNIRLYIEDEDKKLSLQCNLNSSSEQVVHVLYRSNTFIPLNIDENYLKLEEERERRDDIYAEIFAEIETYKQKEEFDDYFLRKTFLLNITTEDKSNESFYNACRLAEKEDINKIIEYFPREDQQQLKSRLEKIASQYIGPNMILRNMLKRFSNEEKCTSFRELCYLIHSILMSSIDCRKERNIFSWIVAAYPQRNWTDELILLKLENYFKAQLAKKCQWREYLSKIENKDILLLFSEKLDQCTPSSVRISTDCVEDIFYLLSSIPNKEVSLEDLGLPEWSYALKEEYWKHKLSNLTYWQESELLSTASYFLLFIENAFGTLLAERLIKVLKSKRQASSDTIINILSNFHNDTWSLGDEELDALKSCDIYEWVKKMQKKFSVEEERGAKELIKLIKSNGNTSSNILDKLPNIGESMKCISKETYAIRGKPVDSFTEDDIVDWTKQFRANTDKRRIHETCKEILAVIDKAIQLKKKFKLRDTQRLTILTLLINNRSTLVQVSTGEGKSLIIVAVTIIKSLYKEKVHVITSSSVLAKYAVESNRDIYDLFKINVSHNCNEDIELRKMSYSSNQVIYGDLSSFQRDYLLDRFYSENVLGDHKFENVIVDEVDSMLLDKGNNMLYLSHQIPDFDKLESVYLYIWHWINKPVGDKVQLFRAFNVKAIKDAMLYDLYGTIRKEDIGKLGTELSERRRNVIWKCLIESKIINNQGKLLKDAINDNDLDKVLTSEFGCYKDRLLYFLKETINRQRYINVPNCLKSFVERHLESWIISAINAFFMEETQDYVLSTDRSGIRSDCNPNITIIDRNTGTDQANSQWDEALHQFLQLKHGCKLSLQSLKAVFISNISFFKLYNYLYGLTGTLGSQRERNLLREMHEVDFAIIPTAISKQFSECKPIICTNEEDWKDCIRSEAQRLIEKEKRSVLIICETVKDVNILHKAFGGRRAKHVHTYKRDYEEFSIAEGSSKLKQGQIIIATNLAGRGTDIKLTKELNTAGGLHVCLTYLPNNIRIEQQAFGRAARNGNKGSGQLIIMDDIGKGYSNSRILYLKIKCNNDELRRLSKIKVYYDTRITAEEKCFKKFTEEYERLGKELNEKAVPKQLKTILLESCLSRWALWLDENSIYLKNFADEQSKENFNDALDKFISLLKKLDTGKNWQALWLDEGGRCLMNLTDVLSKQSFTFLLNKFTPLFGTLYTDVNWRALWLDEGTKYLTNLTDELCKETFTRLMNGFISQLETLDLDKQWLAWVDWHPVQMIKLGKYFAQQNKYAKAIKIFDKVIEREPCFSEAAHYYKTFALANQIDWEQKPLIGGNKILLGTLKKELRETVKLLNERNKFAMNAAGIIGKIKQDDPRRIVSIAAYEEQQKSLINFYNVFLQSINDIIGHFVTPQCFENVNNINQGLAEFLYDDLLRQRILRKPRVKKNIREEELKAISFSYGMSVEALRVFLSKYEGNEIDQKEFRRTLKKSISLPSREKFWKSLIEQKVLSDEIKYVVVDNTKLEEIDPSLASYLAEEVNVKRLVKQSLKSDDKKIFLYPEWITQQEQKDVFIRGDFINTIGKREYLALKEKGILSFNKKANVDKLKDKEHKSGDIKFSHYDSITLEDITKVNIAKTDAEKILIELVEQKAIEKKGDSSNNVYGLKIEFDEIKNIQLPFCPIYESTVKNLLFSCFMYRITLQTIVKQLEEESFEKIRFNLMTKPYRGLVLELLEQRIIKTVTVTTEVEDFENKLKTLYNKAMSKKEFKCLLSRYNLVPEESVEELFYRLVEKKWIMIHRDYTDLIPLPRENFYYYNDHSGKQSLDVFITLDGSTKLRNIDKTVEKVLNNHSQLVKAETIATLAKTLKQLRGALKTFRISKDQLEVPNKLKPLREFLGEGNFLNIDELCLFSLNGLNDVLQLEGLKWTRQMLLNTTMVVALGIAQIIVGVAIELYSMGFFTHVGAGLINEGVGDIMFAAGALTSGYFSWKDYKQHKIVSCINSALTLGIGAYFSHGTKCSSFGYEVAGSNLKINSNLLVETCGSKLIDIVGREEIIKLVTSKIVQKATEAVIFGFINAETDMIIKNKLTAVCDSIGQKIVSCIEQGIDNNHQIYTTLKRTYDTLGEEKARRMIDNLTHSVFSKRNYFYELLPVASRICSGVIGGIKAAAEKNSKVNKQLNIPIKIIEMTTIWLERGLHLGRILFITECLLNDLNRAIKYKLDNEKAQDIATSEKREAKDYEIFKADMIEQWKLLLRKEAGQVISQHIVSPIITAGTNYLVGWIGKTIQEMYESFNEAEYYRQFEELKQKYRKDLQIAAERNDDAQTVERITTQYHQDLLKLQKKTKNPALFAAILRENVPMDMTCIDACVRLMSIISKEQGIVIPGLNITVVGENGVQQEFSSAPEGTESINIVIKLENNHFQLSGNTNTSVNEGNNCLYEALVKAIPSLRNVTAKEFRNKLADYIERDPVIRYHIQQGWHRFPLSYGIFGGASKSQKSKIAHELNKDAEKQCPYQHSNDRGEWKFNGEKDIDLRQSKELSKKELHVQRASAYNIALNKINEYLSDIDKKHTGVDINDFEVTKFDSVLIKDSFGKVNVALYPVEMKAEVEVSSSPNETHKFNICINFDNPVIHDDLQGPHGPHVGYKITSRNTKISGHILVNQVESKNLPDRDRSRYWINSDNTNFNGKNRLPGMPKIPKTRLLFPPRVLDTYLERTDATNQSDINQDDVRGRRYPSSDF